MLFKVLVNKKPESCNKCFFFVETLEPQDAETPNICKIVKVCSFTQPDFICSVDNCPLNVDENIGSSEDSVVFNVPDDLFEESKDE